ncbi:hypothetical protein QE429_000878 [Bacillus sp. SORGH_AS 510]|uniref:DUF6572 domain-containing protein n=1 Tax=Bacillus sp. SORGH_AS_0510 TaxID=3041771 RepID=UPI00277F7E65|nr:DUF6572 domain-containing protein [Bacillus sp. SORGH_AS_0510]MDQ1144051.1 hypothetical protein [Bacillus sp. SORGH_AS_0510]
MSVVEVDKVDGIGADFDEKKLIFMISDHLGWDNEYEHLIIQDKINAYLGFIEAEEYNDIYPDNEFNSFVIQIYFLNEPTKNCNQFLETVTKQLHEFNITIEQEWSYDENI